MKLTITHIPCLPNPLSFLTPIAHLVTPLFLHVK